MANLLTLTTLATWTGSDEDTVLDDEFAADVIAKVSELVCFLGGHPNWSLETGDDLAPVDVRMVVLQVCKRTYENPRQVIQEGNIGPIGGDRVLDAAALLMDLTEYERSVVTKYNPEGDPTPTDAGQVFLIPTTRGIETIAPQTSPMYIGDDGQIGLVASADPREWKVPFFNPGDPGDDANYGV